MRQQGRDENAGVADQSFVVEDHGVLHRQHGGATVPAT